MNVNEILARVVSISHAEDGADSGLREKALGWVNSAYSELLDEVLPYILDDVAVAVDATYDADGVVQLPDNCRRVVEVFEAGRALPRLRRMEFEAGDTGYLVTGKTLIVTPDERGGLGDLRLMYVPEFSELEADGEIEMLDAGHQHALIWGALVWGSTYERAFSAQGDLRLFQAKWEDAKQQIKVFFASAIKVRVEAQSDIE